MSLLSVFNRSVKSNKLMASKNALTKRYLTLGPMVLAIKLRCIIEIKVHSRALGLPYVGRVLLATRQALI
ncbi:hypothetical protein A9Q88_00560 [Gammaproteobacteria bacterium 50_400_T64]|nr:hypothetical protein A9Q88_00560 [Gammaproteobacteria bacterium 50_400_T64]